MKNVVRGIIQQSKYSLGTTLAFLHFNSLYAYINYTSNVAAWFNA